MLFRSYITMPGKSPMSDLRRENGREEPWELPWFAIGNENWGCGGNMRVEYYADLYRQYQTYVRQYGDKKVYKVACGPSSGDYYWTEKLMEMAGKYLDGISLHYYVVPGEFKRPNPSVDFNDEQYNKTIEQTFYMDELITRHITIMDKYDPEGKVDLLVDEWGTWYDVEPGSNPGFLYQQNTMRDAIVAAMHFNIFHKHAKRVKMANIAQMVNVLQAMILTEGDQMIKTPTYFAFDLYKKHMDAEFVDGFSEEDKNISFTASKKNGKLTISLCNYDLNETEHLEVAVPGYQQILEAEGLHCDDITSHNTFENPNVVAKQDFTGAKLDNECLTLALAPASIVTIELG